MLIELSLQSSQGSIYGRGYRSLTTQNKLWPTRVELAAINLDLSEGRHTHRFGQPVSKVLCRSVQATVELVGPGRVNLSSPCPSKPVGSNECRV